MTKKKIKKLLLRLYEINVIYGLTRSDFIGIAAENKIKLDEMQLIEFEKRIKQH